MILAKYKDKILRYLPLVLLIPLSFKVLVNVFISYYTYDEAKVISYLFDANSLTEYIDLLKFGIAICVQMYGLSQIFEMSVQLIKFGSYIFFIGTFVFVLVILLRKLKLSTIECVVLVLSCSIFFFSNSLTKLGSYGMLVYCQSFFMGAILLYFAQDNFKICLRGQNWKAWGGFIFMVSLGGFVDIRFSFYLCMTFILLLVLNIKNKIVAYKVLLLGIVSGFISMIFIYFQFLNLPHLKNFRPAHVEVFLYKGNLDLFQIIQFICGSLLSLVESLSGNIAILNILFALTFICGIYFLYKESMFLPALILLLCIFVMMVAALFQVYPFGSIRYCTTLLPFFIYVCLSGCYFCFNKIKSKKPALTLNLTWLLLIFGFFGVLYHGYVELNAKLVTYKLERKIAKQLIENLNEVPVFCDVVSEKIAKAYGVNCKVITTWNVTRSNGLGEANGYYEEKAKLFEGQKFISFYLWKDIEDNHYNELYQILKSKGYAIKKQIDGHSYYIEFYK